MNRQRVYPTPTASLPCGECYAPVRWGRDVVKDRPVLLNVDPVPDGWWVRDGVPAEPGAEVPVRRWRPDLNLDDAPRFSTHGCRR